MFKKACQLLLGTAMLLGCITARAQTQLTGTVNLPNGQGFSGVLRFSLAQDASVSSASPCPGPELVVPTEVVNVTVTNGTMVSPPILVSSYCTIPLGVPYYVVAIDTYGTAVFTDQWLISGSVFDVGTAVSSNSSPSGGGSGGTDVCTFGPGDTSSVYCGAGNTIPTANPANTNVLGYDSLNNGSAISGQVVAIGSTPISMATVGMITTDVVAIGNNPFNNISPEEVGSSDLVGIGDNVGANATTLYHAVLVGDAEGSNSDLDNIVAVGFEDAEGIQADRVVAIGYSNLSPVGNCSVETTYAIGTFNGVGCDTGSIYETVMLGDYNLNGEEHNTVAVSESVHIGDSASFIESYSSGTMQEIVVLGDHSNYNSACIACEAVSEADVIAIGDHTATGTAMQSATNLVAIGNHAVNTSSSSISNMIAIGNSPADSSSGSNHVALGNSSDTAVSGNDVIAIGDSALLSGTSLTNIIAIGNSPATTVSSDTNFVAIGTSTGSGSSGISSALLAGQDAGESLTTVTDIVAIGDNAASGTNATNDVVAIGDNPALSSTVNELVAIGDSVDQNSAGSDHVVIGDNAGPCTTPSTLTDIIVIGDHACADGSNEAVLGSASHTTLTKLYGEVDIEGTGTTVTTYTPGLFSTLPTCNSGEEGSEAAVTDSTTNTWGATITGSGGDHVKAYCDGTNWTVEAK